MICLSSCCVSFFRSYIFNSVSMLFHILSWVCFICYIMLFLFLSYICLCCKIYILSACFVGLVKAFHMMFSIYFSSGLVMTFHILLSIYFSSSVSSFNMLFLVYCCYEIYVLSSYYASSHTILGMFRILCHVVSVFILHIFLL
jgi:hypothetical protein